MHVKFVKAPSSAKKMAAMFFDDDGDYIRQTQFGAAGYKDFTIHRDEDRKSTISKSPQE